MNPLTYIVTLLFIIGLPAVLFTAFWMFVIKRGWGSKWLLATSFTVFLAIFGIIFSLGMHDNSMLFLILSATILGGIGFYFWLRTSPISEALMGKAQNVQNNFASLSEDEKNNLNQSAKLAIKNIIFLGFGQNVPIIIGFVIILLFRNTIATSLGVFVMGFTGILRLALRPKQISTELNSPKIRVIGDVLITVFAWSLAIYGIFKK